MSSVSISIIVPIYNTEKYLRQCIRSILAQTFTNWECILVDDGSTDDSGAICNEYAKKDSRIKVVHRENGGASSARNTALDLLTGKWLAFVDSDDCIYFQALERLYSTAEHNNLDLLQCSYNRVYQEHTASFEETNVLTSTKYVETDSYLTCVWGTLFKSSIITRHHLRFDERVRLGEDQIFLLNYMQYCKRLQSINDVLYFYRDDENSAVHKFTPEDIITSIRAFKELKNDNNLASKRCDTMLLNWFVSLTLSTRTPTYIIKELLMI